MNLGELRDRAMYRSRDITNVLTSPKVWNGHINAAYLEFVAQSNFNLELSSATINVGVGVASAALPDGVFSVLSVRDSTNQKPLESIGNWNSIITLYPDPTQLGEPMRYKVIAGNLYLFPKPDTATSVEIFYYAQPPLLENDVDEPILPERYHEALVIGAVMKSYEDDHDWEAADRFKRLFDGLVTEAVNEFNVYPQGGYAPMPRARRDASWRR